jgi:adenylate cyclase
MVAPLSGFLLAGVSSVVLSHYMVGRERRFLRRAFEFYLHPEIVKELVRRPEMLKLGGVRREITVFFSDLAGFTSFSEHLDPETLVAVLNRYLSEMSDIIMEEGGTLDKYVGDAIMAFWGAPLEHPDHALRACKAAVLCQKKLDEMRPVFQSMGVAELQARIGINTGPAVVGNMGSEARFNYTAMGDTVNLASRLEGVNKMYGTRILISDATFLPAGGGIEARELDNLRVKGKKLPVKVYELLGMKGEIPDSKRRVLEAYGKALDCYWKRKFEESAAVLNQILGSEPADTPSRVMLERCLKNIAYPPPDDWDGAFTLDTK